MIESVGHTGGIRKWTADGEEMSAHPNWATRRRRSSAQSPAFFVSLARTSGDRKFTSLFKNALRFFAVSVSGARSFFAATSSSQVKELVRKNLSSATKCLSLSKLARDKCPENCRLT
jgi:hypothetical protein